jgi:hypothetical protein
VGRWRTNLEHTQTHMYTHIRMGVSCVRVGARARACVCGCICPFKCVQVGGLSVFIARRTGHSPKLESRNRISLHGIGGITGVFGTPKCVCT